MVKKRDPTSIKTSNLVTATKKIDNQEDDNPLEKKFDNLQKWWEDYIQQSNSRTNPRHSTTDSSAIVSGDLLQLLDSSPKSLMASLQHTESPSQGWSLFNSRKLDRAAVEVIKEREAAFENGRFKGRRLFEETELGWYDNQEISSESSDLVQESEVPTVIFSKPIHLSETEESGISCVGVASVNTRRQAYHGESFMNGGNSDQCRHCSRLSHPVSEGGGGTEVAEERQKMVVDNRDRCNGGGMAVCGGRWMIKMAWAGIMLLTLGIVAIKCRGGEDEFALVPT